MEVLNPAGAGAAEWLPVVPGDLSRKLLEAARRVRTDGPDRVVSLAAHLHGVDPCALAGDPARIAFWVNVYNALFLHATSERPLRLHLGLHTRLFRTAAYRVGAHEYALDTIEHALLRRNRRAYRRRKPVLGDDDDRLRAAPAHVDPRIHFALNCGARSCPPIRAYEAASLDAQLRLATESYLVAEVDVDRPHGRVRLPGLMRLYGEDFGGPEEAIAFTARHLPEPDAAWLVANAALVSVGYRRFDARVAS